ncbi:DUF1707 domain-containing protein [Actinoplanes sp. NPDC049265]|uniref:DUF1707 SHOCT-like domain-containing protein n=1 Tax=Actinoplanes sp. NPDC049265 TaxID=3363902 RepID=UPI00371E361F
MRAGDADRQQVAERLRVALDDGRLDLSEYDDRLRQTYAAKTYGELERVTTDLPAVPVTPAAPAPGTNLTGRWLVHVWDEYVTAVAICVAIWLTTGIGGDLGFFWPIWVAGPWGALLVWRTVSGLASDEPRKWHEAGERKKLKKERKRRRKELEGRPSED